MKIKVDNVKKKYQYDKLYQNEAKLKALIYEHTEKYGGYFILVNYSGVRPGVWLLYPVTLHCKNLIFPLPEGIDCK